LGQRTRLLSAVALALSAVWLVGLAGVAAMTFSDADERFSWLMVVLALTPGYALVPALYYIVRLRRSSAGEAARKTGQQLGVYTVLGAMLFVSTVYSLARM
jgi:hypothetical protein